MPPCARCGCDLSDKDWIKLNDELICFDCLEKEIDRKEARDEGDR